jgi:hypothetical protein
MKRLSTGYRHAGEGPGRGDRRELEHRQVRRGVPLPVTAFWDNFIHTPEYRQRGDMKLPRITEEKAIKT